MIDLSTISRVANEETIRDQGIEGYMGFKGM
jgi:hypothetical protein